MYYKFDVDLKVIRDILEYIEIEFKNQNSNNEIYLIAYYKDFSYTYELLSTQVKNCKTKRIARVIYAISYS